MRSLGSVPIAANMSEYRAVCSGAILLIFR